MKKYYSFFSYRSLLANEKCAGLLTQTFEQRHTSSKIGSDCAHREQRKFQFARIIPLLSDATLPVERLFHAWIFTGVSIEAAAKYLDRCTSSKIIAGKLLLTCRQRRGANWRASVYLHLLHAPLGWNSVLSCEFSLRSRHSCMAGINFSLFLPMSMEKCERIGGTCIWSCST